MDEIILFKALSVYKVRYGYTTNKSIDLEKLEEIVKEIKSGSKTTTRNTPRSDGHSNR